MRHTAFSKRPGRA